MGMRDLHRQKPKDDPREKGALGTQLGNWEESKHPRDAGKFAPAEGGDSSEKPAGRERVSGEELRKGGLTSTPWKKGDEDSTDKALREKEEIRPRVMEMLESSESVGLALAKVMGAEDASRALDVIYEDLPLEEDTPITEALRETLRKAEAATGRGTPDPSHGKD